MKKADYKTIFLSFLLALTGSITAQTWTQKADSGGSGRYVASAFVIGNQGYMGLGIDSTLNIKKDLWQYDPETDTWTRKADFPGSFTAESVGITIANKGYIATDYGEFWEYDPLTDNWTRKADYPGAVIGAASFSIANKGYIATGSYSRNLWEWDGDTASPSYNTWTQKSLFPPLNGRMGATGFSIGSKGYLGTGTDGNDFQKDLWEWDGDTSSPNYNTWTQKASLPGVARCDAVSFVIGNLGYIGTGLDIDANVNLKDFWEWNQSTNMWTQVPDLPGPPRQCAVAFSIGHLGYIGTGANFSPYNLKDFWEYCDTCHVGTDELHGISPGFSVYPNPASDKLHIRIYETSQKMNFEIISIYGNQLLKIDFFENILIDVSNFPTGLYIIKISNQSKLYTTKLIIER